MEFYGDTLFINAFGEIESKLGSEEEMLIIEPKKVMKQENFGVLIKFLNFKEGKYEKNLLQILF